ncbi:MAG TPA: YggS family pyridoxal phosphate-dependent enzyme [Micromonosporaceae bacterium]|nr:YggS family pyridoxal phosphate-dependent enzyme [Micromonosporaceae bacterium]HCU51655.1 YggS family pyridoxal phosphate-dependent enzyme [Micromonosporaceae bacterium]
MDRREEIASNLAAVRSRIAAACAAAGRKPEEITLIAVTKTYPAEDVLHLVSLGVHDIGENRDQEAAPKAAAVAQAGAEVRWHFVGQLQRNKAKSVVTYADMVHSVDSVELVRALDDQAQRRRGTPLNVLVQVSLDDDPQRGGAVMEELSAVAEAVTGADSLRLRGLMAVAPLGEAPESAFARMKQYIRMFQADYPDATVVSAGMSDDLDEAIACGATHVRIGSALLGKRPTLR